MTLHELIVDGGVGLSFVLLTILGLMWPTRPSRCVICFKERQDEFCMPACLRTCLRNAASTGAKAILGLQIVLDDIIVDELLASPSAFFT